MALWAIEHGQGLFCSYSCKGKHQNGGEKNGHWKGGRYKVPSGYIAITRTGRKRNYEHILIAEKALGEKLKKGEVVHHINGDKSDNRNCNLLICTASYHHQLHQKMARLYAQEHFG